MKIKFLVATIMIAFLFSNCSIDKRLYRSGFHIEWRNHKAKINEPSTSEISDQTFSEESNNDLVQNPEI